MSRIFCLALSLLLSLPITGCEGQAAQLPGDAPATESTETV